METFGKFCFAVIVIIFSCVVGGFVFMTLWKWFVVETFAVKQVSLVQSIGLMTFISYIKPKVKDDESKDKTVTQKFIKGLIDVIAFASVTLVFGWVIHQFM